MAKHFPLRIIDETIYEQLEKKAKAQYVSVNTLINIAIEESLKKPKKN
jgi:hypothetical protein